MELLFRKILNTLNIAFALQYKKNSHDGSHTIYQSESINSYLRTNPSMQSGLYFFVKIGHMATVPVEHHKIVNYV